MDRHNMKNVTTTKHMDKAIITPVDAANEVKLECT